MSVVALYARVSTDDQAKHGASIPAQLAACRAYVGDDGPVEEFVDAGVSAETLDRPALSALRERVRSGAVRRIVVLDPDRLARRLVHQLLLADEFERAGVPLEFVNFTWQDSPEGRLFFNLRGAIAEFEREKIRERAQRGWTTKAEQGQVVAGMQRYGYRYDRVRKVLTEDPDTAPVVREIFRLAAEEHLSTGQIAARLSAAQIPAPRGTVWWRDTVSKILRNPAYLGLAYVHRYDDPSRRGQRADEWIAIPVPALVDETTWWQAREVIYHYRKFWKGRQILPMLLRKLVVCGRCGHGLSTNIRTVRGVSYRYYFCPSRYARHFRDGRPPTTCTLPWIPADPLETAVWADVARFVDDPDGWAAAARDVPSAPSEPMVDARAQLARIARARDRLLALIRDDLITEADARRQLAALKRDEAAARQALRRVPDTAASWVQRLTELRARMGGQDLSQLDFDTRVQIVREVVERVVVDVTADGIQATVTFRGGPTRRARHPSHPHPPSVG